ncbi:MAG: glycosyltransferase [Phycisphaerales bacterium]
MNITLVAAVNDDAVLERNLLASPLASAEGVEVILQRGAPSAARAYNEAIDRARHDVVVLAHQDVYIPAGWERRLEAQIERIGNDDWGVLGVFGVTESASHMGRVWCTGNAREFDYRVDRPTPAVSFDELLLVVRKSSGLRFDERVPSFHMYGTDIAQRARAAGLGSYIIDAPVIHNSLPVRSLGGGYAEAYRAMQRIHADRLPIPTCIVPLTRHGLPLKKSRIQRTIRGLWHGFTRGDNRNTDPASLAATLGYDASDPAGTEGAA